MSYSFHVTGLVSESAVREREMRSIEKKECERVRDGEGGDEFDWDRMRWALLFEHGAVIG